ncbi:MAG: tripartite tricarboxylate transporter TctB family protein [Candidatus Rokubacteria bacterium]|nr:tripartite tricarboxylate transporter TctB family protein [Candidatus Rokubacteria bacterium]
MLTRDRFAGIGLLLFALGVIWEARVLPLGNFHNPGPAYMPVLFAIVLAALASVVALGGGGSPRLAALGWEEKKHALAILGGCAFAALAIERLGFRLTVLILLAFILWLLEGKRAAVVAAMALGLSLGTFFLFHDLLKVPLPRGPFGF